MLMSIPEVIHIYEGWYRSHMLSDAFQNDMHPFRPMAVISSNIIFPTTKPDFFFILSLKTFKTMQASFHVGVQSMFGTARYVLLHVQIQQAHHN